MWGLEPYSNRANDMLLMGSTEVQCRECPLWGQELTWCCARCMKFGKVIELKVRDGGPIDVPHLILLSLEMHLSSPANSLGVSTLTGQGRHIPCPYVSGLLS